MFSILIHSYNNLNYLKLCVKSILKNSINKHEIIVHVNEGSDGTLEYVKNNNLKYTFTNKKPLTFIRGFLSFRSGEYKI